VNPSAPANSLPRSRPNCAMAYKLRAPESIATDVSARTACNDWRRPDASGGSGTCSNAVQRKRPRHD
jgi:hypothetical protein